MNEATRMPSTHVALARPWLSPREVFVQSYQTVRRHLESHPELGLLLVACEEGNVVASHWLPASAHHTTAAVVGRHSHAALALPPWAGDVSLRHLMVTCRATSLDDVRLRVMDLGTHVGFRDETGHRLGSVTAEGPLFLQVGSLWLMVLVTGSLAPSGDDPEAAYDSIPERVFLAEETSGVRWRPPGRVRASHQRNSNDSCTVLRPEAEPVVGSSLIDPDETPLGHLIVRHADRTLERAVGARTARRGVVIGRYERCQLHVEDGAHSISRVHLLIVRDGDALLAIDTASTNGTITTAGEPLTVHRFGPGANHLELPGRITLAWRGAVTARG